MFAAPVPDMGGHNSKEAKLLDAAANGKELNKKRLDKLLAPIPVDPNCVDKVRRRADPRRSPSPDDRSRAARLFLTKPLVAIAIEHGSLGPHGRLRVIMADVADVAH